MKNIFKSLFALALGVTLFASCQEAELLGTDVKADVTELSFAATSATPATINVTADGSWISTSPDWITVDPAFGNGNMEVTVTVADNVDETGALMGPRTGSIQFAATDCVISIEVKQEGDASLDTSRKYVKVTDGIITSGKAYIIVVDDGSALQAMKQITPDKTYGYLYPREVTDVDGTITLPDASLGFILTASDGGFQIQQNDGRYVAVGSYDSYNVYDDPQSKADGGIFTFVQDSDGTWTISNAAGKWIQYSTQYSSLGCYNSEKGIKPLLYRDTQDAVIDETKLVCTNSKVSVAADATTAEFAITSNLEWAVTLKSGDWIKDYTKSGANDGKVTVTFDAYENTEADRTAEFEVKSTDGRKSTTLTLTQAKKVAEDNLPKTIAALNATATAEEAMFSAEFNNVIVTYVNGSAVFMEDATAGVELYLSGHTCKAGQKITGPVTGKIKLYNGFAELTAIDLSKATVTENNTIPCTTLTAAALAANYKKYFNMRVKMEGVEVTTGINGKANGTVKQGTTEIAIRGGASGVVLNTGDKGDLISYPQQYSNALQTYVYETSWFDVKESGSGDDGGGSGDTPAVSTIAELNALATDDGVSFNANFNNVIVTYVNGSAVFMEDATAGVELYLSGNTCKAGQKITGPVSGTIKLYNGFAEMTALDLSKATVTENNPIPCKTVTAADLAANYKKYFNMRVKMEGVEVTTGISGKQNGAVKQDGTTITVRGGVAGVTLTQGKKGDLISYPQQYSNALQAYVYENSWFTEAGSGEGGEGEGGETGGAKTYTIDSNSGFQSSYKALSLTIDGVAFSSDGMMYNGKGTPSGYNSKDVIQCRKSGSGAGTIYNNASLGKIKTIKVYSTEAKTFSINYGTSANPTANTITSTSLTTTTESVTVGSGAKTATVYTFDLKSASPSYFSFVNGGAASYIFKFVIECE